MPIDASIPLQVRPWQVPDYSQTLGNALSLKGAITADQQQQQQIQEQQALRDIWKQSDTSTPEGKQDLIRKAGAVNPSAAQALSKQFGEQAVQQSTIAKNTAQRR